MMGKRAAIWAALGCLAVLGLAAGLGARRWLIAPRGDAQPMLTLEPAEVEIPRPAIQGELLTVYYQLRNVSDREVTVQSLPASCSCMTPVGPGGKPLNLPFTLAAGQSLPLSLSIVTLGRVGPQRFYLSVAAREGDRDLPPVSATITARVLAALRAQPYEIILRDTQPGVELRTSVELADMLSDPGVEVASVTSSRPDRLRAELVPVSGPSRMFGEATAKQRYRLDVSYTADDSPGTIQESLALTPKDTKYVALTIPVYCTAAEPPYSFTPRGLTIAVPATTAPFKRTVLFRASQGGPPSVALVGTPAGLTVTITRFGEHAQRIEIEGETPAVADIEKREILFAVGEKKQPLAYPVTFIGPAHGAKTADAQTR